MNMPSAYTVLQVNRHSKASEPVSGWYMLNISYSVYEEINHLYLCFEEWSAASTPRTVAKL